MFNAEIIADTIWNGSRITTFVATYPRIVHSEVMTHCALARNAASSRAIPISKMIDAVRKNPVVPIAFGSNQRGMQAGPEIEEREFAKQIWLQAATKACGYAESLEAAGVHKQIANRVLEPFMWMTTVITATDWANFYAQRVSRLAQPEFMKIARMMLVKWLANEPEERMYHLPFVKLEEQKDYTLDTLMSASAMRCARVSYTNQGKVSTIIDDATQCVEKLIKQSPPHMSPTEHPAFWEAGRHAKFANWRPFRRTITGENIMHVDYDQLLRDTEGL